LIQVVMREEPVRLTVQRPDNARGNWLTEVALPSQSLPEQDMDSELFDRLGMSLARPPALLGEILPGGPAAVAGLQAGDQIQRVDNQPVIDAAAFIAAVQAAPGRSVAVSDFQHRSRRVPR
jgi:regulator of sigma E protease